MEVSSSYLQKYGILYFLPEESSGIRVYFFPRGERINIVVLEFRKRVHSNIN